MLRLTPTEAHATSLIATKWPGMTIELERNWHRNRSTTTSFRSGALAVRCVSKSTTWEYRVDSDGRITTAAGRTPDWYAELMENRLMEAISS